MLDARRFGCALVPIPAVTVDGEELGCEALSSGAVGGLSAAGRPRMMNQACWSLTPLACVTYHDNDDGGES